MNSALNPAAWAEQVCLQKKRAEQNALSFSYLQAPRVEHSLI